MVLTDNKEVPPAGKRKELQHAANVPPPGEKNGWRYKESYDLEDEQMNKAKKNDPSEVSLKAKAKEKTQHKESNVKKTQQTVGFRKVPWTHWTGQAGLPKQDDRW